MPFAPDALIVDRFSGMPLHRQLADRIRDAITSGTLRPGEPLPSEAELAEMAGVSKTAVRNGLDLLVAEGRIVKRSGTPTRVATPPPVRHMATSRYQRALDRVLRAEKDQTEHPLVSGFTEDHGVAWNEHTVQASYRKDFVTDADAALLTLPGFDEDAARLIRVGSRVLRRSLVKLIDRDRTGEWTPEQLQESVMPLEMVAGTAVEDPKRQPWPGGTIAELHRVGHVVSHVSEMARSRMPTPDERRELQMEVAGPVWDIVRVFYEGPAGARRPVEWSTVVSSATAMALQYETDLHLPG